MNNTTSITIQLITLLKQHMMLISRSYIARNINYFVKNHVLFCLYKDLFKMEYSCCSVSVQPSHIVPQASMHQRRMFYPFKAQEDAGVPSHGNFNFILRRNHQKISYSVAPMSRQTKRAYLRLCPEKRRRKNLVHKGLIHPPSN